MSLAFDSTKYYLGSLCKRNHVYLDTKNSLKYIKSKACVECYKERGKFDLNYIEARKIASKNYENSEHGKIARSIYRKTESRKEAWTRYNQSDKRRLVLLKYTKTEKFRLTNAKYRATDKGRLKLNEVAHRRRARIKRNHSSIYSLQDIKTRWAEFNGQCAYCSKPAAELDHFISISKGGSHTLGNLLPSCRACNANKFNHAPDIWYKSREYYCPRRWKKILKVLGKTEATLNQLPLF